jgi:histidine ammonia-lyase
MAPFYLGRDSLTPQKLIALGSTPAPALALHADDMQRLENFRSTVESSIAKEQVVYGINTGFGFLSQKHIPAAQLHELQVNLIRSHACGVGPLLPQNLARSLLVLRTHTFLLGHSGVSRSCVEKILEFLAKDLLPVIPQKGSVGASGDLAPLAHLALGLIGEGELWWRGEKLSAASALERAGVQAHRPVAKEGLSLINGTLYMAVVGSQGVSQAWNLSKTADIAAAMSLSAIKGSKVPFDPRISAVRPQAGQIITATNIRTLLAGEDSIMASHRDCDRVQDPYSFRCVPQVHGPSRDTLAYADDKLGVELNSVTDNPLVMEAGDCISGGNFHGQAVALPLDFLAIAMAELGSISERRCEKMVNPHFSGLPPFVVSNSGLNSGFMIPHVVAAALVSENKIYCHPASVDSIPTSAEKEDHVSMGPIAAHKLLEVNRNVAHILAIELIIACQALDFLLPLRPAPTLQAVYAKIRSVVPFMEKDRSLSSAIEKVAEMVLAGDLLEVLKAQGVKLH